MPVGDPALTYRDLDNIGVDRLVGVGAANKRALAAGEIHSLLDLLQHYPRRYLDRTRQARIAELVPGDEATVLGSVRRASTRRLRGARTLTSVVIEDGSQAMTLTFFNQRWRERQLTPGMEVLVHGRFDLYRGSPQMSSPVVDLVGNQTGRVVPVYPQSEKAGLTTHAIAALVEEALRRCADRGFADPLPEPVLTRHRFVTRSEALRGIHMPESMTEMNQARRRLVFDELLRVQIELVRRKRLIESETAGIAHRTGGELIERFRDRLPFPLTAAQQRAISEIDGDLGKPTPMHRLLQGDVGSGKTVVAVHALLVAVQGGHQGALMVPTEVLAEQHHLSVTELLGLLGDLRVGDPGTLSGDRAIRVELLVGRVGAAVRRRILEGLAAGKVDIVIGTHALIQQSVDFASLGVVVVDEQHRFGVEQRAALREKGGPAAAPDVLVMTATPIPRTAAMTVYGDLDMTTIDELPPGRTPIKTVWVRTPLEEYEVWQAIRAAVAQGRQAYVVCPQIGEADGATEADTPGRPAAPDAAARSATATFDELTDGELKGLDVALLHGRVPVADKEATMGRFRAGAVDVLVATTVIEVGVDVPNATVMVILDADRFGIAQLHQLRGRVGRGEHPGRCYLVAEAPGGDSEARLGALVDSTDGFVLAETDLELRGEGTIMGERQRGRNDLRLASLRRDKEWVAKARAVAFDIIDADPELARHPGLAEELEVVLGDDDADFLMKG